MRNVLIVSPNFFYFGESIASAFEKLGWKVSIASYDSPVHPYDWKNKIRYKISFHKEEMVKKGRLLFSQEVKRKYDELRPDLLFVVNGAALIPEVVESIHQTAKVAVWFFDSVCKYPIMKEIVPYSDAVFCYEQSDMKIIEQEFGRVSYFLPQAADLTRYYKIKGVEKKYDLVFAGDIWQSEKRQRIIRKVVENFPNKKILVWGVYKPWYKGLWRWLTRERRDIYMNRNTSSEVLNQCYNESRLVLNIHNEQQKDGANPKVYEIAASGARQLCDSNSYIEHLFPAGAIDLYHSEQECIDLISKILNEKSPLETADMAWRETLEKHSFEKRISTVLSTLELL